MYKLTASALAFVLVFALAVPAHAQIGVDVGGGTSGSAGGSDADVTVDADLDASVGTGDEPVSSDEEEGSGASTISVSLTQDDVVSASLDAESAALSAVSVSTSADLSAFATAMMKRDLDIKEVDASGDRVSLEYRKSARFLGFIPGSIRATAEVRADGTVEIDYPWYRFLFAVEGSASAEADLEARAREIMANAGGSLTARAEAELLEAMHTTLSGSAVVEAGSATTADMAGPQDGTAEIDASEDVSSDADLEVTPQ